MPMKMLIARDMSEGAESNHNPPNVVAKLMGLDALPRKKLDSAVPRHSRGHSQSHSGIRMDSWKQDGFETHHCRPKNECKQKGNYINEKKMSLIRQKFTEVKRLSTDEKLCQSKQFQDAVEVLSYNKDLFLQFLEEENSFSQHLFVDFQPPASETKRITVLRPSKVTGNNRRSQEDEKQLKKTSSVNQPIGFDKSNPGFPQDTQIVILKPSLGKPQDITWKKFEDSSGHRRDETLLSNDGSSFRKPENDFAAGNDSERQVVSPSSSHSWDYINMCGSPYSSSSFSHASYSSPESSVCRQAKKRLSERWSMMASNENSPEQIHVPRSSENVDNSSRNLLRSESLPVSSTVFGGMPNVEVPDPEVGKTHAKEVTKQQSVKSSLKERVSSLLFSKKKKTRKEKSTACQSKVESKAYDGAVVNVTQKNRDKISQCANDSGIEECALQTLRGSSSKTSLIDFTCMGPNQIAISTHGRVSVKLAVPGHPSQNQDHLSPSSVLEPPFEEDNIKSESYYDGEAQESEVEEKEWLFYIQSLLSVAGLDGEAQSDSFFTRWHSPETLLDPSLREKYMDLNDKEAIHGVQPWKMRLTQKLVFDCVNEVLVDITRYMSETIPRAIPPCRRVSSKGLLEGASPILANQVWEQVKQWFPRGVGCFSGAGGDNLTLVVEWVVRKEVMGKGWVEQMRFEVDNIVKEIEGILLEEAVVELIGSVH